ncbi:carbohydrate ABC transporter substrate-binding protein, partial [Bauldia litoralis]
DLLDGPATTWDAVMTLARSGAVLCPLRPPHSLMVFYTLAANLGTPCANTGPGDLIAVENGRRVLGMMRALFAAIDPACLTMDPIDVFEEMTQSASTVACAPLIYGYIGYGLDGFREKVLAFADIPVAGHDGPVGSAVGGTGIAVSARSAHPAEASDFAYWIASGDVQRGPYAAAGGQPGHAAAWEDEAVNAATGSFYRNTRATLEGGWVRPRHHGYMAFQQAASDRLNQALQDGGDDDVVIADLNSAFRGSFR